MATAGPYLLAREDAHCLLLGLVPVAPYRAVVTRGDEVVAAAVRTPSRPAVLSEVADRAAVDVLAEDLADDPLPGVTGPPDAALRFAERRGVVQTPWATRAYRADAVVAPSGVPGSSRIVTPEDRELLLDWCAGFIAEAVPNEPEAPASAAERILRDPDATWLWIDDRQPVALARYGSATPRSVRVGFVYTPPERRGRGYASALVAAMTQELLDRGWAFVTLFTDLTNPTSNRIYQRIGYRPVCDMHTYWF